MATLTKHMIVCDGCGGEFAKVVNATLSDCTIGFRKIGGSIVEFPTGPAGVVRVAHYCSNCAVCIRKALPPERGT